MLLYRYETQKRIDYLKKTTINGMEVYSLGRDNFPHPSMFQYEDYYFVKCNVIMHILESRIQQDHYQKLLKVLVKD